MVGMFMLPDLKFAELLQLHRQIYSYLNMKAFFLSAVRIFHAVIKIDDITTPDLFSL